MAALLAGCGGPQPPTVAPGAMPPSTTCVQKSRAQSVGRPDTAVHYVYVTNDGSGNVSAYAIDASTGALTKVKGSPFSAGPQPWGIAVDPTGKFAYVTNVTMCSPSATGSVSAYAINASSGALTQVKGSPFNRGASTVGNGDRSVGQVRLRDQLCFRQRFRLRHRPEQWGLDSGEGVAV